MSHKNKIKELVQEIRLKANEHNDKFLHGCADRLGDIASTMDDDSGGNPPSGPGTPTPPGTGGH